MCGEIYELDPSRFLSAPGLTQETALKKTKVKLDLLIDLDICYKWQKKVIDEEFVI